MASITSKSDAFKVSLAYVYALQSQRKAAGIAAPVSIAPRGWRRAAA